MTFHITADPDFNTDYLTSGEIEDMLEVLWADATEESRARVLRKSISIEENKANIAFSPDARYEVKLEDEDDPDLLVTITCVTKEGLK
jgi:hypothetical protein